MNKCPRASTKPGALLCIVNEYFCDSRKLFLWMGSKEIRISNFLLNSKRTTH